MTAGCITDAGDGIVRTRTKACGAHALAVVGTFQESSTNDDPEAPSILVAVGTGHRSAADRSAIAAYLRRAPAMWKSMGLEIDLLDPSQYAGSGSLLGDGAYAWPDTLAHYVALDDVGLPADFEAHVRAHAASAPDPAETTQPAAGPMGPSKPPRLLLMAGNFRELGFLRAIGGAAPPSFVAARGKSGRTAKTTESVARYLRAGWELGPRPQQRSDVFEPSIPAGHTGLLTDGVYAWPHLLAHYVERYDVALPPDFEERMRKRMWSPPMAIDTNAVVRP